MKTTTAPAIQIEHVPIDDLRPDPANPRKISDAELEALIKSIAQFGLIDPIIARRHDGIVIGGHQRLLAARRLGLKTVPTIYVDLPLEQARLLNVALNKISGSWDEELLAQMLADLSSVADLDLTLSGFDEGELDKLLRSLDGREHRERAETFDLDAALEDAQAAGAVSRGDLWALGPHRVLCGDATDQGDVARLLGGQRAALAFTDPPYNVGLGDHGGQQRGQRKRRLQNDALDPVQWETFCRAWARNLLENVDGALYVCMAIQHFPTILRVFQEQGGHWSDTLIWAKDRHVLGRADYQRKYEPIFYGWREGAKRQWHGGRDQTNIWEVARPGDAPLHPTMKPLELVERALENSSRASDAVLDLFLGSGSTLVACERTGRVCYGLELQPRYGAVAIRRWEAFTGGTAERVGG
jgi:DNA modification methylase